MSKIKIERARSLVRYKGVCMLDNFDCINCPRKIQAECKKGILTGKRDYIKIATLAQKYLDKKAPASLPEGETIPEYKPKGKNPFTLKNAFPGTFLDIDNIPYLKTDTGLCVNAYTGQTIVFDPETECEILNAEDLF